MNAFLLQRQNQELRKMNAAMLEELQAHRTLLASIKLTWLQRWRLKRIAKRAAAEKQTKTPEPVGV